ncbi:orotate phosphoribosyltransferase [Candidatus Bathyarchaeota archaeon]|nr:orotate phosphoribosyltransferase [Candidatus Bathyarchaeota archaeon]
MTEVAETGQMLSEPEKDEVEFCRLLLKTGALKFGTFKLTSGKLSPYYVDLRSVPSYPEPFRKVIEIYERLAKQKVGLDRFDRISCVPTSGLLFASVLAFNLSKPILYARKEKKAYGRQRRIEGVMVPGDRIIIVDDLVTTGRSLVDATEALRAEGGVVTDALALIDREEGGRERLREIGVRLNMFMRISQIAGRLYELGVIEEGRYQEILAQISTKQEGLD